MFSLHKSRVVQRVLNLTLGINRLENCFNEATLFGLRGAVTYLVNSMDSRSIYVNL
jgi:hypothetical protein